MNENDLAREFKLLRLQMEKFSRYYTVKNMFVGGMLRGMGILVGATLLVLVGSTVLGLFGFLPGLSDVAEVIMAAFDKAKLQ